MVSTTFWTSTEYDKNKSAAWIKTIYLDHKQLGNHKVSKGFGFSIRCIKD